jgi:hypothetical protein
MTDATELDALLNDPSFARDPYPAYSRLRAEAPVFWSERQGQWIVSRLRDCQAVLRDTTSFSSVGWEQRYLGMLPEAVLSVIPSLTDHVSNPHLLISDAPVHDRLRAALRQPFLPKSLESWRPRVTAIVAETLDGLVDVNPIEVVSMIAHPLPVNVISDLLGATREDRAQFRLWSGMLTGFFGQSIPDPQEALRVEEGLRQFRESLSHLMARRREAPLEDIATALADPTWDSEMDRARLGTAVLLVVAGHETTRNLIATSIWALLLHPDQLRHARSDPAAMDRAIGEALRWDSPLQRVRRVVRHDCKFGNVWMRQGERVAVLVGAANRDPELCERPDEFDVQRRPTTNLAFGSGAHFCLGNSLAMLEAGIAVPAFFQRFPDAALDESWRPTWRPMNTQRSLIDLKVRVASEQ